MSKVELESRSLLFGSVTLLEGKIMIWNNIDLAEGLALLSANGYWLKGTSAKPLKRLMSVTEYRQKILPMTEAAAARAAELARLEAEYAATNDFETLLRINEIRKGV